MKELERLTFALSEKTKELIRLGHETFVYNPRAGELAREIAEINFKIEEIKKNSEVEEDARNN